MSDSPPPINLGSIAKVYLQVKKILLDVGNEPILKFAYVTCITTTFGKVQTRDRQKAAHMIPPCKEHRWAQKAVGLLQGKKIVCNLFRLVVFTLWTWS